MKNKKTVVFDFDGVIHSYKSGWQGIDVIPDEPVPGIKEAIAEIRAAGYNVTVVSTRCEDLAGVVAICNWLEKYGIEVDATTTHKPPAEVYIDDRAILFDGNPKALLKKIQTFVPWHKKGVNPTMKKLNMIQKQNNLNAVYHDEETKSGGAYSNYYIFRDEPNNDDPLAVLYFQNGPRNDPDSRAGILDHELLEIVRDRLKGFQSGPFPTRENACALTHIEEALMWMNKRVEDRAERGVLGKNEK